jgi:ribonucleoside-diphosphate reductase alpha chain
MIILKNPHSRAVIESPQYFFMRVACGLSRTVREAIEFYDLISTFDYMPSTPTLFNSGTRRPQMSSCYLLDSPKDDLKSIYKNYLYIAQLSKFAGGIGLAFHRIRSRGSLIMGTNGLSNGIMPFLKTLDSSVLAVNQGGKRKGACAVSPDELLLSTRLAHR